MGEAKPLAAIMLRFGALLLFPVVLIAYRPAWWTMHTLEAKMASDPIDRLSYRLDASNAYCISWNNGFSTLVELPDSSTPEEIIGKYFIEKRDNVFGNGLPFKILELKPLPLNPSYSAALIETGIHRRIVLFQNWQPGKWSFRDYEAE